LKDASVDIVLSNAVLEHVRDLAQVAREMARITRPGGTHSHQIDCRDHKNFGRPLDHLLIPEEEFAIEREKQGCMRGTQLRMQEIAETFACDFWLDEMEPNCFAEADYLDEIAPKLRGRYKHFPRQSLRITGGRLWLTRKTPAPKPRRRLFGLG
jgi:SAM-dependent methyltransferase